MNPTLNTFKSFNTFSKATITCFKQSLFSYANKYNIWDRQCSVPLPYLFWCPLNSMDTEEKLPKITFPTLYMFYIKTK